MQHNLKYPPSRDFQAENIARDFETYSDWLLFHKFCGGSYISSERYHRAKLQIKKSAT